MLIIPSIDLFGGRVVRLFKGDYDKATVYADDPLPVARAFEEAGARLIHIVDLDRARGSSAAPDDTSANRDLIRAVRRSVSCAIEVGGGVRSESDVAELLDCGVERIVIGTALVRAPDEVAGWIAHYRFCSVAGLDARDRRIRVQGWTDDSGLADTALAVRCREMGFQQIVYTNIAVDGTLAGPDLAATNEVAAAGGLPVILSGGIGRPEDVEAVANGQHKLVAGVIIGKAYYEKKVDLADLILAHQTDDDRAPGSPQRRKGDRR
ncbi:MAG: 1-(5-phosphoribosyl)-5-((5-phosphoribosylamino)methylideneamino)imidazole-4-carboxamide isomerase [Spirochaetales bacterium]|nr:1-(5-phosphoribosyl)-5-((5-phosphoribosylamino)methylideneamino)imidazole-4-carboxamide isomerase [Spirochaetales bacterium]